MNDQINGVLYQVPTGKPTGIPKRHPKQGQIWTPQEIETLKELAKLKGRARWIKAKELLPDRTHNATKLKFHHMNLSPRTIYLPVKIPLSPYELGFIVALIEGEGSITLRRGRNIAAVISVANTDYKLLEYAKEILGFGTIRTRDGDTSLRQRICYVLYIETFTEVADVLETVKDSLISFTKRKAASLVYRFCISRITKLMLSGRGRPPPYSEEELDIAKQVAEIYGGR